MKMFVQTTILILFSTCNLVFSQQDTTHHIISQVERFGQYKDTSIDEFIFKDEAGKEVKLSSFKGKFILLDFWETVCAPCLWEIPDAQKLHKRIEKYYPEVIWLTISSDRDKEKWKQVIKEKQMPGINLLSTRKANSEKFHVTGWPTYLLLNPQRKIIGFNLPTPSEGPLLEYIIYKGIQGSYAGDAFQSALIPKKDEPHAYDFTEEMKKWMKEVNWR